jgi:parallel beta-helix repeat protein
LAIDSDAKLYQKSRTTGNGPETPTYGGGHGTAMAAVSTTRGSGAGTQERGMKRSMAGIVAGVLALRGATLAEEGRLEISQATMPCTITNAGSYILTENVGGVPGTNGITVAANDVTLDLNGFALIGRTNAGSGIAVMQARTNLVIRNGVIRDWGHHGVDGGLAYDSVLSELAVTGNGRSGARLGPGGRIAGCRAVANKTHGFEAGLANVVADCASRSNGQHGILMVGDGTLRDSALRDNKGCGVRASNTCIIVRCTVRDNGDHGIEAGRACLVEDCVGFSNDDGVRVSDSGGLVARCVAYANRSNGVSMVAAGLIRDCNAAYNYGDGIAAGDACDVVGNASCTNYGGGIRITGSGNRVESNHAMGNRGIGVAVSAGGNILFRNTASGNGGGNFAVSAGNHYQYAGSPGTNFPTNPWLNFGF